MFRESPEVSPREGRLQNRAKIREARNAETLHEQAQTLRDSATGLWTPQGSPDLDEARNIFEKARAEQEAADAEAQAAQLEKEAADAHAKEAADAQAKEAADAKAKKAAEKARAVKEATERFKAAEVVFENQKKAAAEKAQQLADEAAERVRIARENEPEKLTKEEIERILGCNDSDNDDILDAGEGATEEERLDAWIGVGCNLHPKYCNLDKAKDAYESK